MWTGEFPLNFDEFKRKQEIKAQAQAEAKDKGKGTANNSTNKGTKYQKVNVDIPTQEFAEIQERLQKAIAQRDEKTAAQLQMELNKLKILGNDKQRVSLVYDPKSGRFFTPMRKLPVDVNNPWDVWEKLRLDQMPSGGKTSKTPKTPGTPRTSGTPKTKTSGNPWRGLF